LPKLAASVVKHPNHCGRLILEVSKQICSENDLADADGELSFSLTSDCVFSQIYPGKMPVRGADPAGSAADLSQRICLLRKRSAFEFGIGERFVRVELRTVPIEQWPAENDYTGVIALWNACIFETSPISFCRCVHAAFHALQEVASRISWETKQKETGKVVAKTDHLLSLDDLVDISSIVLLLAETPAIAQLTDYFERYAIGMELTSELAFVFTSLLSVIQRLREIDLNAVAAKAKERIERASQVDPLFGL
jgi:hypothetical protein